MRKTLFESKSGPLWIKIVIYEANNGNVVVHGHDSGKVVKKIKHSYDYEYYLTIETQEIKLLKKKLELNNTKELFNWFEKNFSTEKAISQIKETLEDLEIKSQFSTW